MTYEIGKSPCSKVQIYKRNFVAKNISFVCVPLKQKADRKFGH